MAKSKKILRQKKKVHRNITEEEHIEMCIKLSERCIDGTGSEIDEFFKGQAARQRKKLEDLRLKK